MSTSKYVSEIKIVQQSQNIIYNFLSDFNNLGRFFTEEALAAMSEQLPKISIEDFRSDADSCHFKLSGLGEAGMRIIDREEPKTIKIQTEGKLPFNGNIWIQLVPAGAYQTKLRVTLHADLNMMMKMMVGKKLQGGVDQIADGLARLPYH